MKINHIALYTNDLERTKNFYETYFSAVSNQKYENLKTGLQTYFLSFEDGARLELMTRPQLEEGAPQAFRAGWVHLAFSAGSKENVNQLTERLAMDGFMVLSAPRITGDGYYESCVADPDGNQVEIVE